MIITFDGFYYQIFATLTTIPIFLHCSPFYLE